MACLRECQKRRMEAFELEPGLEQSFSGLIWELRINWQVFEYPPVIAGSAGSEVQHGSDRVPGVESFNKV